MIHGAHYHRLPLQTDYTGKRGNVHALLNVRLDKIPRSITNGRQIASPIVAESGFFRGEPVLLHLALGD